MTKLMIKATALSALLMAMLLTTASLSAGQLYGPHNHGAIDATVYRTADTFEFEMITPSNHVVGFEVAPQTSEEKLTLRNVTEQLKNPVDFFAIADNASCTIDQESIDVSSEMILFHKHSTDEAGSDFFNELFAKKQAQDEAEGKTDSNDVHTVGVDGHSDFRFFYKFNCETFGQVSLAGFFEHFKELERVDIHAGDWKGKVIMTLTKDQPVLDMRRFTTIYE